jgi:hypothetical protein
VVVAKFDFLHLDMIDTAKYNVRSNKQEHNIKIFQLLQNLCSMYLFKICCYHQRRATDFALSIALSIASALLQQKHQLFL